MGDEVNIYRIPWLIGQFLPLGFKLGHHLFETDSSQVRFWRATGEYIFLDPIAAYKTTLNLSVELDAAPLGGCCRHCLCCRPIVPMALDGGVEWSQEKNQEKWNED